MHFEKISNQMETVRHLVDVRGLESSPCAIGRDFWEMQKLAIIFHRTERVKY